MPDSWKTWSISDWNERLLTAVFYDQRGESNVVRRIDSTEAFLARVAGEETEHGPDIRKKFVSLFADSRTPVSSRLDAWHPSNLKPTEEDHPPFFAALFLTLIVSSATEETHDQGNFRARFTRLLGLPETANFNVPRSLPQLWEQMRHWSLATNDIVKQLELPDPKHETIIGYSKRLAFPSYRDAQRLARVIQQNGLSTDSPAEDILLAIGAERSFTPHFTEEFHSFKKEVDDESPDLGQGTPFWAAFGSVSWEHQQPSNRNRPVRVLLELDLRKGNHEPTFEFFVCGSDARLEGGPWRISPLSEPLEEFDAFLQDSQNVGTDHLAKELLLTSGEFFKRISGSPLAAEIKNGCVIFAPGELVPWQDSRRLPQAGPVRLLMRGAKLDFAKKAFAGSRIGEVAFVEWKLDGTKWELSEEIVCDRKLMELNTEFPFNQIGAFKKMIPAPKIEFREGIRMADGFLFLPPIIPKVSITNADGGRFRVHSRDGIEGISGALAEAPESDSPFFRFTERDVELIPVPGEIRVQALRGDRTVEARSFRITNTVSTRELKSPEPYSDWLREDHTGQLSSASAYSIPSAKVKNRDSSRASIAEKLSKEVSSAPFARIAENEIHGTTWNSLEEMPRNWADTFESLAGVFSRRRGCSVPELLEWIRRGFRVDQAAAWSILKSLVSNGIVARYYHRRWSGQRIFPQSPSLVRVDGQDGPEVRLFGLASFYLRRKLATTAAQLGIDTSVAVLGDWSAVGCIRLSCCESEVAAELAEQIRLPLYEAAEVGVTKALPSPIDLFVGCSDRVNTSQNAGDTRFWAQGRFIERAPSNGNHIRLEERRFERQQAAYILLTGGKPVWWTQSPVWARLLASRLIDFRPWKLTQNGTLVVSQEAPDAFGARARWFGGGVSGANWKLDTFDCIFPLGSAAVAAAVLGAWAGSASETRPASLDRWTEALAHSTRGGDRRARTFRARY